MKFGCMGKLCQADAVRDAGFDRMELDLREIMELDDGQFRDARARLKDAGLEYHVCSWILPIDLDITAPDFDRSGWYSYLSLGADRCASLGVRVWPFGTGKGRSIKPQNGDPAGQAQRVADFLAFLDETVSSRGIISAIEPLGPANSNFISTLAQADSLRRQIGSDTVRLMCDLRHMVHSHDPYGEITVYGENIVHCHIDYPLGDRRIFPEPGDGFDYVPYLSRVSELACGSLAFEAIHSENAPANMRRSLEYIRSMC